MAQLVSAILSNQDALAATAFARTGDHNEASLLVGRVLTRAFNTIDRDASAKTISDALRRDLERMLGERRFS